MSQIERLYKLKSYLDAGRCLTRSFLLEDLRTKPSSLKRDIAHLRNRMGAPIIFDREGGGWRLDKQAIPVGAQYELPGLWLAADEMHALLSIQHLLVNLDAGGLLGRHIEPLMKRLTAVLDKGAQPGPELARRIRVQTVGARRLNLPHFQAIGSALLRRQRLVLTHYNRGSDETREREVSPQRLIHYRDNWYLDAWCHMRRALRSFSVDAIRNVQVLAKSAIEVPDTELDAVLGSGYGIFAGKRVQWASLRFTPERARWVAAESWHPRQEGRFDADGSYLLRLPYADPRELVMDILRHVPEVQVIAPESLRELVRNKLQQALNQA